MSGYVETVLKIQEIWGMALFTYIFTNSNMLEIQAFENSDPHVRRREVARRGRSKRSPELAETIASWDEFQLVHFLQAFIGTPGNIGFGSGGPFSTII